ncbi:MAG: hypothetical protein ABFC28_04810 [Rikenellaceae bacterium]
MRKLIFVLSVAALLFSCTSVHHEQQNINEKLVAWDRIISENPKGVIDSLKSIQKEKLSTSNLAYYSLLRTIAGENIYETFKNDSAITLSVNWYRSSKNYYNYCRSLLYKGIVIYGINRADSSAYMFIKQAEETYVSKNINDMAMKGQIYIYLGKISSLKSNFEEAESYLKKSIEIYTRLNDVRNVQIARLDLFWSYFSQKKYSEALSNIITFADSDTLSPHIQYEFYNALAGYYSAKKDYKISTEYIKKMLKMKSEDNLDINYPKLYYSLASYYKRSNRPDSCLFYSKLAVKSITDSSSRENHFYYRYLADLYSAKGDYKQASEHYRKAYFLYIKSYSKLSRSRFLEIEKRYDLSRKEAQLSKSEAHNAFLFNVLFSLLLLIVLIILFVRLMVNGYKKKREHTDKQIFSAETELKESWFINEVQKVSAGLLPKFIEDVNIQANRSRKFSKELSEDLNKSIDEIRTLSKNKFAAIVRKEAFLSLNPNLKYFRDLSDLEKITLALVEYDYSTQEIADILCTSTSSIRATKTKIRDKITGVENLPFDPRSVFKIFEKE